MVRAESAMRMYNAEGELADAEGGGGGGKRTSDGCRSAQNEPRICFRASRGPTTGFGDRRRLRVRADWRPWRPPWRRRRFEFHRKSLAATPLRSTVHDDLGSYSSTGFLIAVEENH
jgi:hypothetical protein